MRRSITVVWLGVLFASCDQPSELVVGNAVPADVVGLWVGQEDITTAEDPGSGNNMGSLGFTFPVALHLQEDGRFRLTTTNFATRFDNEAARTCDGIYTRRGGTIEFFANRACRALPLSRFSMGRVLPRGLHLNATTARQGSSPASIRVIIRVNRE
jgi:hypothetical protein